MIDEINRRIDKYELRLIVLRDAIMNENSLGIEKSLKLDRMCVEAKVSELQELKNIFILEQPKLIS